MLSLKERKSAAVQYIIMSVLLCLFGLLLMIKPDFSVRFVVCAIGILLLAVAVVKLITYFCTPVGARLSLDLMLGIALIVLGIIVLTKAQQTVSVLFILIGIPILADGIVKLQNAVEAKRADVTVWWIMLIFALLSVAAGVLLIFRPYDSVKALTVLMGAGLFIEGIMNLFAFYLLKKTVTRDDVIEIDGKDL